MDHGLYPFSWFSKAVRLGIFDQGYNKQNAATILNKLCASDCKKVHIKLAYMALVE